MTLSAALRPSPERQNPSAQASGQHDNDQILTKPDDWQPDIAGNNRADRICPLFFRVVITEVLSNLLLSLSQSAGQNLDWDFNEGT